MGDKTFEFSNPENLPVELLTLEAKNVGVVRKVKALDPFWLDSRDMIPYERPPRGSELSVFGAVDTWKAKMETYLDNLQWLLSLEHFRFWSTVIYYKKCMDCLVSFLQESDPPYIPPHEDREIQELETQIRRYVLVVYSRLITNKESESEWMSKEYMGKLIYDQFIFTIPVIWDICLAYGTDNAQHVSRLLSSVFALQPQYEGDTATALKFVKEAFKFIILQVNKDYDSVEPPNLPQTFKGFGDIQRPPTKTEPDSLTFNVLKDLVIHLLDTAMTLRIFVEVYPQSVKVFRKTNFVNSIVQIYEYGIPQLYDKLEEVGDRSSQLYTQVEEYIDLARSELIDVFREILAVYKNAILSGEGNIAGHVEDYLTVMMDGLAERLLIQDYHACYPVHEDLEMLRQAYPNIDSVKTDFILQAVYSNLDEPVPQPAPEQELTNGVETTDNTEPGRSTDIEIPETIKEESLIQEVKDVLPHLGDGFILKCLKHYGFNAERVINSILEDSLDESLRGLDQSEPLIPEDPLDQKFLETGIARLNVFDGDEFDIMTRDDVDLTRIHVGKKKSKYKDLKQMLDDKTEIKKMADIYSKYSLVDEDPMYSDEYDDTYDSDTPAPAPCEPDDGRPIVTPRALLTRRQQRPQQEESEESESEEDQGGASKNRLDFCVNPEVMRARREANMQARQARRGKGQRPPPARTADVTGKPRGQGQEKEVVVNRDRKEKHKSARANHNRRQGAQWKRTQGMMPS